MPPGFIYLSALLIWCFFAVAVWVAAGLMRLSPRTRPLSRPLSFAMAGTFPFVFAYQILAAPLVAVVLLAAWIFWKAVEPGASTTTDNPLVILFSILAAVSSFSAILVMSMAGFYEGWRTGWKYANGRPLLEAACDGPTVKLLYQMFQRARARSVSMR